ncbi:MAG: hypothetical protein H6673_11795 [Anaerolineales bacterium]|nr:hypothetical protein [Anaerolineales bacterium]
MPNYPEIQKCPRCGNNILIGDQRCSRCGQDVTSLEDKLRALHPVTVGILGFTIGGGVTLAAITGMDGILQLIFLAFGFGTLIASSMFVGLSYTLFSGKRRRK